MKPDGRFLKQPKSFWAYVRSVSQELGYTVKGRGRVTGTVRIPDLSEICSALQSLDLDTKHIAVDQYTPTPRGRLLLEYFKHRADILNNIVRPQLMDASAAKQLFGEIKRRYRPPASILPMNKQKGKKKAKAYFTCIINILIWANASGIDFDHDPRALTTVTRDGQPLRTLARRVDGAFPASINPIAVWEIKEYYYTTTFGSRVADGVYESLLDGLELEELREHENIDVRHYLMVDAFRTWWKDGKSYLCRIVDMLHMGYVDEVLFGNEVVDRLPGIVADWVALNNSRRTAISDSGTPGAGAEPKPEGEVGMTST